jgi:hypothetical protein
MPGGNCVDNAFSGTSHPFIETHAMKLPVKTSLALLVLSALLATVPAHAASSLASESSDGISASVGAISNSIKKSSNSSSKATDVAAGDYKIIEVAAADKPGTALLHMQALADSSAEGELTLTVPQTVVELHDLHEGSVVTARLRNYGIEFAAHEAFFLVLKDAYYQELQARPVSL